MRYANILKDDVINGKGVGVALFTQGCPFHCKGCFNPETWNFVGGKVYTRDIEKEILEAIKRPYITRFTILGGEPFIENNFEELKELIRKAKEIKPYLKIWAYTGNTFEKLTQTNMIEIISEIDYLIDGRFIEEEKDLSLKFRGSRNQRIIDVKNSLEQNKIILYLN